MGDQNLLDKSMRSVFVGNIPYEATEEKLKDIFNEVGPVLSFKLVYDRETGKPKGYGFCEYKDQETALSAMRNLNGYEIGGRMLRVDNACTEKSRLEMQSLLAGPTVENQYGESVSPEKAPEAISKAVASLPPEQMFELMRQMKLCVQNNPVEARNMLLQNSQLAYAILQAQVVMRIVDPQVAVTMLQKANPVVAPLLPVEGNRPPQPTPVPPPQIPRSVPEYPPQDTHWGVASQPPRPPLPVGPTREINQPPLPQQIPPPLPQQMQAAMPQSNFVGGGDMDMRSLDPRIPPRTMGDQDLRMAPQNFPQSDHFIREPRTDPRAATFPRDPRGGMIGAPPLPVGVPRPVGPPVAPQPVAPPTSILPRISTPNLVSSVAGANASDQEKAALIMQVLQLSDDQIAKLPAEQRQSILVLKEQIAKSTQR